MRLLPGRSPRLTDVANTLNVSSRQLQRKLAMDQTSFEQLLTDIRKNLCPSYLKRKDYNLSEVAFLLGFSSQSNFSRAFKLWFEMSPSEFRKNL
jgi:AraC-like DNA-binding protein